MKSQSLALKITLVLLFVSLLGISFVTVYASQITKQEFSKFLFRKDQEHFIEKLVEIYEERGNWDGVTLRTREPLTNAAPRMVTVADESGRVIIPGFNEEKGSLLSDQKLSMGLPVEVDGQTVGWVISSSPQTNIIFPVIESFSDTINRSLLMGGLIAIAVSLFVGVFFSYSLTRRLNKLVTVAQAISKGELDQQVKFKSKDEIGKLADAINQMSADLKHSQELRQQMTADIAHELRTPLSIIVGRTETLAEGMLPPTQKTFQIIHDEALHINRLVEDLRTLSLSDAGELQLEKRAVWVNDLLEDFVAVYKENVTAKNISLLSSCPENLPDIHADPDRLKQVLANLMSNAIRYTPAGGTITLSAAPAHQGVTIILSDNGPGISSEDLPYIFERFYRGDKAREREKGGSGLGLAIAKSLVQAHGGQISVSSQPGCGTKFSLWLPAG